MMKMKMKMKNRSHRYDINRPKSRHGHKYNKYKNCLSMMIITLDFFYKQLVYKQLYSIL